MEFVQGLPKVFMLGKHVLNILKPLQHPIKTCLFNLALHVNDDAERVQQHRMLLLN